MLITKTNIKKILCMFPPGCDGKIDWKNIVVVEEEGIQVTIPLHFPPSTCITLEELREVEKGMERVFGPTYKDLGDSVGLVFHGNRVCLNFFYADHQ